MVIAYNSNAQNYTTLRFPSRCTEIRFIGCSNDKEINPVTSRSFTNNIVKVEILRTVNSIGNYAFEHSGVSFQNLKEVVIQYGVVSIESKAFESCMNLTNIAIPDSVTSIEDFAF